MLNIGDFARHGRVSVRMLRHYDAIGLLTPARVDPHSGYRSYQVGQLAQLNRIVALKELGFTVLKHLPAARVAELTTTAASFGPTDIGPVVRPLCAELGRRLATAQITPTGRLVCYYEKSAAGDDSVTVHAAIPIGPETGDANGLTVTELPAAEAATVVHRGAMDGVLPSWQSVARWIDDNGYRSTGVPRELYLECPEDESAWVTELQEPVVRG